MECEMEIEQAYEMFCGGRNPPATQQDVAELERVLGITFPESYIQYLMRYNGGDFTGTAFDRPLIHLDDSPSIHSERLECLYPVGPSYRHPMGKSGDIDLFEDNRVPIQLLPIGQTESGGLIYIVVIQEDDYGQIGLKTFTTSHWLADDISGLFRRLEPFEDRDNVE